jgi:hypothetical protein
LLLAKVDHSPELVHRQDRGYAPSEAAENPAKIALSPMAHQSSPTVETNELIEV